MGVRALGGCWTSLLRRSRDVDEIEDLSWKVRRDERDYPAPSAGILLNSSCRSAFHSGSRGSVAIVSSTRLATIVVSSVDSRLDAALRRSPHIRGVVSAICESFGGTRACCALDNIDNVDSRCTCAISGVPWTRHSLPTRRKLLQPRSHAAELQRARAASGR